MELLGALELKIKRLMTLVKELQNEKEQLLREITSLKEHIERLELALSTKNDNVKEWDRERACARKAVDELIADIDSLIESGSR